MKNKKGGDMNNIIEQETIKKKRGRPRKNTVVKDNGEVLKTTEYPALDLEENQIASLEDMKHYLERRIKFDEEQFKATKNFHCNPEYYGRLTVCKHLLKLIK
jgi:hypothetical protein